MGRFENYFFAHESLELYTNCSLFFCSVIRFIVTNDGLNSTPLVII